MPREEKKRKRKDSDLSEEERGKRRKSKSPSPSPVKERRRSKSRSASQDGRGDGGGGGDFSLSIEETNKLRAQLGLALLETDDKPKIRDAEDGNMTDKIINEEGFEFRHRKAENWSDKKKDESIKEKIEVAKKKREIYSKVLKSKGLAEDSSDDETSNWVSKQRHLEDERKKAEERAKLLDQMDEEFGVSSVIEEKKKQAKKKDVKKSHKDHSQTGGLIVGHSKKEFLSGQDQILVLEDKGVLDEGDEVLVNPNIIDKERTTRNVELRKRKGNELEDELDEWGNPKDRGMLAKYDEELEGATHERFRLDASGKVDIEKEREEEEMRKRLMLAGKTLVDLDDSNKYHRASEYYTQEEMISFRKVKKEKKEKKSRKRGKDKGMLKADDLVPIDQEGSSDLGARGRRRRHEDEEAMDTTSRPRKSEPQAEDGEIEDETPDVQGAKWRRTQQQAVDLDALKRVVERELEEEDSDDDLVSGVDLSNVVLDYDAQNELQSVLEKTRRLKQQPTKSNDIKMEIKEEQLEQNGEVMDVGADPDVVMIDSTMEYCRNIGEIRTHGIAGNREEEIDFETEEDVKPPKVEDEEKTREKIRRFKEEKKRRQQTEKEMRGGWTETTLNPEEQPVESLNEEDEEILQEMKEFKGSDSEDEDDGEEKEEDVLGGEIDATKGIGAMLKLAAKKGYLEDANRKRVAGENLDHLKSKSFSKVETAKFDIEEKYTKKLEKMGTTGRGPTQEFCEKKHYKPEVDLNYVDNRGRELDPKDAFRIMSWKFHGKMPGKRQQEKRARQIDQKELLKTYVSSSDTPLGTLSRQRKKQEQLQTPYLVLSGNSSHQNFKKD